MAEPIEDTLGRLNEIAGVTGIELPPQRSPVPTLAAGAGESPEETLARMEARATPAPVSMQPRARFTSVGGIPLPEAISSRTEIPAEFSAGFNQAIGNLAGLLATPIIGTLTRPSPETPEGEAFAMQPAGEQIREEIARSQTTVQNFLKQLGIVPQDFERPETLSAKVGAGMVPAVVTAGAMLYGGPAAARLAGSAFLQRQGVATTGYFPPSASPTVESIGQFSAQIAARPATAARAILSGELGAGTVREFARPGLEATFPGTEHPVLASLARTLVSTGLELVGGVPTAAIGSRVIPVPVAERLNPMVFDRPILSGLADPELAGSIIRSRQVSVIDAMDRQVARTIQRAGEPGLTEETASIRLREGLLASRDYMNREVDRAYAAVPRDITGNPRYFRDEVLDQLNESQRFPSVSDTYPTDRLRRIQTQLIDHHDPQGRPVWRNEIPVSELHNIRSRLLEDSRIAAEVSVLGPQASRQLKENVDRLRDAIDTSISSIGSVNPRFQPAFDYANNLYRTFNDRFLRGPIGDLLMTTRHAPQARAGQAYVPGTLKTPPTQVAKEMLNANETAEAVHQALQIAGRLSPRGLGGVVTNITANRADQAIRAMFEREILRHFEDLESVAPRPQSIAGIQTTYSTQRAPVASTVKKAQNWIENNEQILRSWTNTTTRLFNTATRLNNLLRARDRFTSDIANSFLGQPAQQVIDNTIAQPVATVRARFASLFKTYQNIPEVLEGLQRGVINSVFGGRGADPNIALDRMRNPNYRAALEEMFRSRPKDLDRLYDMVEGAANITGAAVSSTAAGTARIVPGMVQLNRREKVARWTASNMARIFGLIGGNVIVKVLPLMGGAGSLSIPMRSSTAMRDLVAAAWLKDKHEALKIVEDAVFNPGFEAWLRNTEPHGIVAAQQSLARLERILRITDYAMNEGIDTYLINNGRRLYQDEQRQIRSRAAEIRRSPFYREGSQ